MTTISLEKRLLFLPDTVWEAEGEDDNEISGCVENLPQLW